MKTHDWILLVDGNNFYASCERIFQPKYKNYPVVILSNNDGCIIARSNEAKDLGIAMGAPVFKERDTLLKHNVKTFSANFPLYGDLSNRMMHALSQSCPRMEVYSIDEAFLFFDGATKDQVVRIATDLTQKIYKEIGLPISIGIAKTKVLAKTANRATKKLRLNPSVYCIDPDQPPAIEWYHQEVENIWGIGDKSATRLKILGIHTIEQFANAPHSLIRKALSVVGDRIQMEIKGTPCIEDADLEEPRKNILTSRSFGKPVTTLVEMSEAIATYISRAAEKLREDQQLATVMHLMLRTNRFSKDKNEPYLKNYDFIKLPRPTNYTPEMISIALKRLEEIFVEGQKYKKAGILLSGLIPQGTEELTFDDLLGKTIKKEKLMQAMDAINNKHGKDTLQIASSGIQKRWKGLSEQRSPEYTTNWNELKEVK